MSPYNNATLYVVITNTSQQSNCGSYSGNFTFTVKVNGQSEMIQSFTTSEYSQCVPASPAVTMSQFRVQINDDWNQPVRFQHPVYMDLAWTTDLTGFHRNIYNS